METNKTDKMYEDIKNIFLKTSGVEKEDIINLHLNTMSFSTSVFLLLGLNDEEVQDYFGLVLAKAKDDLARMRAGKK